MGEIVYIQNDKVVTDSLMVAEVFGKRHDIVLRDVRNQIEKLNKAEESEFSLHNFEESDYKNERGKSYTKYLLTEDAFTLVTMSYNTIEAMKFKVKYINEFNRMRKLVGKSNAQIPSTFAEALRLAADQHEEIERMKPQVESFQHFIDGSNYQKMNEVAKSVGYGRNKLFELLRQHKILMKDNTPYQRYIESDYFVVKERPIKRGEHSFNKTQTYVTPKGVNFISKLINKQNLTLVEQPINSQH